MQAGSPDRRYIGVNAESAQPTDGAPRPATPATIAIAAGAEMQSRIATALAEHGLRLVAQARSSEEAAALADSSAVIVFACEVDAPRAMAGLRRLCREAPDSPVIVISPPSTGPGVRRALDAGATGVVFEPELELTLATAVRAVASGQSVVPSKLRASVERPVLSHREQQVLTLIRNGLTNAEIAERLFLAESTIKSHVASIFTKFGVRSRKEVAAAFVDLERTSLMGSGDSAEAAA